MPEEIIYYVTSYGYLAIFILVFLQETGVPNPLPNEILLIFSGYMCSLGRLILPLAITTAVLADIIGTGILYLIFYHAGSFILRSKPRWIPLSEITLEKMKGRIVNVGRSRVFIFRCTPFTRGYRNESNRSAYDL